MSRRWRRPSRGYKREKYSARKATARADPRYAEPGCHLFTILGPAGAGKSRLTQELIGQVEARSTALRGRCLPYGEGITFWPVREAVKQASGFEDTDSPEEAGEKIQRLLEAGSDAPIIAKCVEYLLDLGEALSVVDFQRALVVLNEAQIQAEQMDDRRLYRSVAISREQSAR